MSSDTALTIKTQSLEIGDAYETYKLGNFKLKSGGEIPDAFLAYKTLGDPSLPAIVYPTWYAGRKFISDNLWLTGRDKTLNPDRYFIIIPALFGNNVLFYDNVRAQHELITKHLGVTHARAVLGWSMGAGQTYQWLTQYPDFMDIGVPFCGSARTSLHNQVFLEGVKSALYAALGTSSAGVSKPDLFTAQGKRVAFTSDARVAGLKALGRVYAGWGFSQAFYREKLYETAPTLGFKSLDDFLVNFWEAWALSKDPEGMLVMAHTWQAADCAQQEPYQGDLRKAMQGIKAKTLVLPAMTDLYFPPEDSEIEVANMKPGVGTLQVFPSVWGHWAGGPGQSTEDVKWLDDRLREFFAGN